MSDLQRVNQLVEMVIAASNETGLSKFVAFDFGNTLIWNDVMEALLLFFAVRLGKKEEFRQYYNLLDQKKRREAYQFAALTLQGMPVDIVEDFTRQAIRFEGNILREEVHFGVEIMRGIKVRVRSLDFLSELRRCGIPCLVITASPEAVVRAAMKEFGIHADGLYGIRLKEKDGIFTPEFLEPIPIDEGKVACLRTMRAYPPIAAVGDGEGDYAMLNDAEIKIVVNRSSEFTKLAQLQGWQIL